MEGNGEWKDPMMHLKSQISGLKDLMLSGRFFEVRDLRFVPKENGATVSGCPVPSNGWECKSNITYLSPLCPAAIRMILQDVVVMSL